MTASLGLEGQLLHDEAGGRRGRLRSLGQRAHAALTGPDGMPALAFTIWLVLSLAVLLWMWGLNPLVFPTPDESVVRYAAETIRAHGSPILKVPFPDPEDMAHPRSWVTLGAYFVPTYAPVSLYLFGYLLRLGRLGLLSIATLPAASVAAFAAGTAYLLPRGRRWLALFAPALAFPALYWLLRPWINVSPLLGCLCWALFFWSRWRGSGRNHALGICALFVGLASAIRPDYAAFLLLGALLVTLAASPHSWRAALVVFTLAGACALSSNLWLNRVLTGHALRAAYQVALDRQWGPEQSGGGLPGLAMLRVLLVPMGWPIPRVAVTEFQKYWLKMGPIGFLLLGQLALVPLLLGRPRLSRLLYGAAFLLCAFFVYTRLHADVFGGTARVGWAEHSVPRYVTPAYLFAALPPLLFLGRLRHKLPLVLGCMLVCAVAASGLYQIVLREPWSFASIQRFVPESSALLESLKREIPDAAMVYTVNGDKLIWSHWRLGTIEDLNASAASMARAAEAGFDVYMLDGKYETPSHRRLGQLLAKRSYLLLPVDRRHGVYRLQSDVAR